MKRTYRLPCGCLCAKDREAILEMCAACKPQWQELHERARIDHQLKQRERVYG